MSAMTLLVELALKSTLLLLLTASIVALLWRSSAAVRHLVWTAGVLAVLILPLLSAVLPPLQLKAKVLPQPLVSSIPPSPPAPDAIVSPPDREATLQPERVAIGVVLTGITAGLAWLAIGAFGLARFGRRAEVIADEAWLEAARRASIAVGLRRSVVLLRSPAAVTPATWGVVNPAVVLPPASDEWGDQQRIAVLAHELGHVKRLDCLTQTMAQFACVLFWWQPLMWYAARRLRIERERACDDLALQAGVRASDYASHLLAIARMHHRLSFGASALISMAKPSQLESRLLSVLDETRVRNIPRRGTIVVAALIALIVVAPLSAMRSDAAVPERPTDPLIEAADIDGSDVNDTYVEELRRAGYGGLSAGELASLQSVDVRTPWIEEMNRAGYGRLSVAELVRAKSIAMTVDYLEDIRSHGYPDVTLADAITMKSFGVSGAYIDDLRDAGLYPLDARTLAELHASGVTGDFVRQRAAAGVPPSPQRLIRDRRAAGRPPGPAPPPPPQP